MFERLIKSSVFIIKQVISLELKIQDNDQWIFHKIHMKVRNKRLLTVDKEFFINGVGELKDRIPKNIPLCVTITGKNVLERIVPADTNLRNEEVLRNCFPNIHLKDFYYSVTSNNKYTYLAISRRSSIDQVIDKCRDSGIVPVELYLGHKTIENILSFDLQQNEEILIGDIVLKVNDHKITEIQNTEDSIRDKHYRLGNELFEGVGIPAFASGFSFLVNQSGRSFTDHEQIKQLYHETQYKRAFRLIGVGFLAICFPILLSNFLVFSSLNNNYNDKSAEIGIYNELFTRYKILEADLKQKKELLEITGLKIHSRISFYADKLASVIPDGIKLQRMNIHPFRQKRRNNDFEFSRGLIEIEGETDNSDSLNSWIRQLKKFEWIKSIEVKEYQLRKNDEPANFKILIVLS